MNRLRLFVLLLALVLLAPGAAYAQCTTSLGPCVFPPGPCAYLNMGPGSSYFGGHELDLYFFESSLDCAPPPGDGISTIQIVHATAVLRWTPGGGAPTVAGGPVVLTIRVLGGPLVDPRPFSLELLALDLSSVPIPGGVRVRESPTIASVGQAHADEGPPGTWLMDSFFDVFTEISLDDGQSWIPSDGSQRMLLVPGPPLPARPATWGALKATYR